MSDPHEPTCEMIAFLLRFESGKLSDDELAALTEALRQDPNQRAALIETLRMSQGIRAIGEKRSAEQTLQDRFQNRVKPISAKSTSSSRPHYSLLKLAAILLVSAIGIWVAFEFGLNGEKQGNSTSSGIVKSETKSPIEAPGASIDQSPSKSTTFAPEPAIPDLPIAEVEPTNGDQGLLPEFAPPEKSTAQTEEPKKMTPAFNDDSQPPVLLGYKGKPENQSSSWPQREEVWSGVHFVEDGLVRYRLTNGVRLDVAGPTRFRLENVDNIHLISGKLSADVVSTARGFRVDTNRLSVVDLGTRFAVTANEKGDSAVHVYDGIVEATPKHNGGKTIELKAGDTKRLNLQTNRLEPVLFQTSLFTPKPLWTGSIAEVSPNVRVLDSPPKASDQPSLQTGEFIVFRERSNLALRRALIPDLTESITVIAKDADKLPTQETIPARTRVSTYLVRFSGKDDQSAFGEATIHFDSPVIGIIFTRDLLFATDEQLGAKHTLYPSPEIYRSPEKLDELEISENRRSIRLRFLTNGIFVDHARIIVARD